MYLASFESTLLVPGLVVALRWHVPFLSSDQHEREEIESRHAVHERADDAQEDALREAEAASESPPLFEGVRPERGESRMLIECLQANACTAVAAKVRLVERGVVQVGDGDVDELGNDQLRTNMHSSLDLAVEI
eukprot:6195807-Pleurochrysis_carterae.AAC.3